MSFFERNPVSRRARALSLLATAAAASLIAVAVSAQALVDELGWAYASMNPMPSFVEDGTKYTLPGSDRSYTRSDTISFYAPADWFPGDHPAMPPIVANGREAAGIWACSMCHYPNGQGRPENAGIAGLNKAYFIQQMLDFKNGLRRSTDPTKTNSQFMIAYAAAMSAEEIEQAAAYFSSMRWRPWIEVMETDTVPKTHVEGGVHLPLDGRDAGREPIGQRIIEMPKNVEYSEIQRNPRVGWIAYAPVGSIARGEALAQRRGTATACTICHGESLDGLAVVPALRGRSPSYIARQLGDFKSGARRGAWSALMAPVVASLTRGRHPERVCVSRVAAAGRLTRETLGGVAMAREDRRDVRRIAAAEAALRRDAEVSHGTCCCRDPREVAGVIVLLQQPHIEPRIASAAPIAERSEKRGAGLFRRRDMDEIDAARAPRPRCRS